MATETLQTLVVDTEPVASSSLDRDKPQTSQVFGFQADGEIVWAHAEERKYRATQNLRTLEQRLGDSLFQQVPRSVLLNTDKIRKMSSLGVGRWLLTLTNRLEFTVSRRRAAMIDDFLRCGK